MPYLVGRPTNRKAKVPGAGAVGGETSVQHLLMSSSGYQHIVSKKFLSI